MLNITVFSISWTNITVNSQAFPEINEECNHFPTNLPTWGRSKAFFDRGQLSSRASPAPHVSDSAPMTLIYTSIDVYLDVV
jgi:hypothetical protein